MGDDGPWYDDPDAMARDDAHLAARVAEVHAVLCPAWRARLARVHVYPSRGCTYTLGKRRVFVGVRDEATGALLPDCALRHIVLHELAHVANAHGRGHDAAFAAALAALEACAGRGPALCPEALPDTYNAPCRQRTRVHSPSG